MYEAHIYYEAYEDIYEFGQAMNCDNSWHELITAKDKADLKQEISDRTYTKWTLIDRDEETDGEEAFTYRTSYLATAENDGEASREQIEQWKHGKRRLWSVDCTILVSEVTKKGVAL